jgi:flagellin FlaB
MNRLRKVARAAQAERGITGLETAIILIAFVVVATVFAFVVLTSGVFSAERGKETVFAGLQKARGTIEIRGGVVATSAAGAVTSIQITVANVAAGDAIPLDPAATTNRSVIAYRDNNTVVNDVAYTVTWISGDADNLLEPGELAILSIDPAAMVPAPSIAPNVRFTFELQTPVGAVIDITRQIPPALDPVMQLH